MDIWIDTLTYTQSQTEWTNGQIDKQIDTLKYTQSHTDKPNKQTDREQADG